MREILFRGKVASEVLSGNVKADGVWVYGFYRDRIGCPTISEFDFSRANYIDYEIDRETLGQYTGLTDKNGAKIFEGDIVFADGIINTKVVWDTDNLIWSLESSKGEKVALCAFEKWNIEVVGNVFEDSEFLRG